MIRNFLLVLICFFIASCSPSEGTSRTDIEIISGEIGGQTYYVPKAYFKLKNDNLSDGTIYVQAMFPHFHPLMLSEQEYWEKGQRYRNIRILANFYQKPAGIEILSNKRSATLKASQIEGMEFGLAHRTQPEGQNQDNHDMWIEESEGATLSFITCSKRLTESSVPQCKLHYFLDNFHITTSFDKRLLPEWKSIKSLMLELFASFESESAASLFFTNSISKTNGEGDNP